MLKTLQWFSSDLPLALELNWNPSNHKQLTYNQSWKKLILKLGKGAGNKAVCAEFLGDGDARVRDGHQGGLR